MLTILRKIIDASKLHWISVDILPNRIDHFTDTSVEVIMIFDDGFVTRGHYNYIDEHWYGYDNEMKLVKFFTNPYYYILL
jgi:hypothetical protein